MKVWKKPMSLLMGCMLTPALKLKQAHLLEDLAAISGAPGDSPTIQKFQQGNGVFARNSSQIFEGGDVERGVVGVLDGKLLQFRDQFANGFVVKQQISMNSHQAAAIKE